MDTQFRKNKKAISQGFTLIELLVSVAIFTTVMVIALGALLSISASGRKAETLKSVINNLNFALDSMSRSIRTGYNYNCAGVGDCASGGTTLSYKDSAGLSVAYKLETSDRVLCQQPTGTVGCLARSLNGGGTYYPLTAPEVIITNFKFFVVGSVIGDTTQPKVAITLSGFVQVSSAQTTAFNIQTAVTQRLYDQ